VYGKSEGSAWVFWLCIRVVTGCQLVVGGGEVVSPSVDQNNTG
jgi:hypothetical protein